MGGRSSKTKPAQSPVKSQNQDTVVQAFDMDAAVDEVAAVSSVETAAPSAREDSGVRRDKHATSVPSSSITAVTPSSAHQSSLVHDIWEGKVDNNVAPLSALYGSRSSALELQVSSSEDEDEDPNSAHPHSKKRKKKKSVVRKKKKSATPADAVSAIGTAAAATTSVLKPVKPPPHSPIQHTPVGALARSPANDDSNVKERGDGSEKPPAAPKALDPLATSKAGTSSRFFAFSVSRKSFSRPPTSTKEKDKSVHEQDRSSRSPEKTPATPSGFKQTGASSLERFMEWKEGTYRSSGRDSSTQMSVPPRRDELLVTTGAVDMTTATAAAITPSNNVEDFDELERETERALALVAPIRTAMSRSSPHTKSSERRLASSTTPSPTMSTRSQRSSRSVGRNLDIDDLDENIMNDILAETVDP